MTGKGLRTPVLLIIFNKPETTRQAFERIRQAMPSRLYIAADGPRQGNTSDFNQCQEARIVKDQVDWYCEVKTLYRDDHLGVDKGVSTAIDWFFENEPEGIILEDDCLPTSSFFLFCQELLDRYREDNRVMHVCGSNPLGTWDKEEYAYYFSRHASVRGWAGWRRAWKLKVFSKARCETIRRHGFFDDFFPSRAERALWFRMFDELAAAPDQKTRWADQWAFTRFIQSGLSIVPRKNLITRPDHKDTVGRVDGDDSAPDGPLIHPPYVIRNLEADAQYFSSVISGGNSA